MRYVPLAFVVMGLMAGSAYAAPPIRLMMAEQVADAPTDQDAQTDNGAATQHESPSKKLSQSKGVIHPPPTGDHSVVNPPPDTTGAAVVAPPGTPGGDQHVQPK
jgi:hypothetical protein